MREHHVHSLLISPYWRDYCSKSKNWIKDDRLEKLASTHLAFIDQEQNCRFHLLAMINISRVQTANGSRPLTVGEIEVHWSDGACFSDTLVTKYNVYGENPLPILQENIDLHQQKVDEVLCDKVDYVLSFLLPRVAAPTLTLPLCWLLTLSATNPSAAQCCYLQCLVSMRPGKANFESGTQVGVESNTSSSARHCTERHSRRRVC